jgi:hypothetical protein
VAFVRHTARDEKTIRAQTILAHAPNKLAHERIVQHVKVAL